MIRELIIYVYLKFFSFIFRIFNIIDTKNKTTFVVSFGGNIQSVLHSHEKILENQETIILESPNSNIDISQFNSKTLCFTPKKFIQFIQSIYHLATSSHIIVDNYYAFLSVTNFKDSVKCVQLWHAVGAFKKFGLEDATNTKRSKAAVQRFQDVYNRFDYVSVGSDNMADIFKKTFGLSSNKFIYSGVPRTDFFFDSNQIKYAKDTFNKDFPMINNRKVLLYAPTYRNNELNNTKLHIDIDRLYQSFKHEYVLLLRLHPAVSSNFENKYPGFIFNVTEYPNINHLLVGADILITDYSSIPFEYALLNKPMIFYLYDFETYKKEQGLFFDDINKYPGAVTTTTDEVISTIKSKELHVDLVQPFADQWNKYSNGHSSDNLIYTLYVSDTTKSDERKIREYA